jgi:hypothetical protein
MDEEADVVVDVEPVYLAYSLDDMGMCCRQLDDLF